MSRRGAQGISKYIEIDEYKFTATLHIDIRCLLEEQNLNCVLRLARSG